MEIAKFYTDAFFAGLREASADQGLTSSNWATNCIGEYIKIVEPEPAEKEYAYCRRGNVYFDTAKLDKYYVFHDHNEEDLAVGVREGRQGGHEQAQ